LEPTRTGKLVKENPLGYLSGFPNSIIAQYYQRWFFTLIFEEKQFSINETAIEGHYHTETCESKVHIVGDDAHDILRYTVSLCTDFSLLRPRDFLGKPL
jgi:hypothetical protein